MKKVAMGLIFAALLALSGCAKEESAPEEKTKAGEREYIPNVPQQYAGAMIAAHRAARRQKAKVEMKHLLEVFRAEHERYPNSLDELREMGYEVPPPPERMKYVYDPSDGSIAVVLDDGR